MLSYEIDKYNFICWSWLESFSVKIVIVLFVRENDNKLVVELNDELSYNKKIIKESISCVL